MTNQERPDLTFTEKVNFIKQLSEFYKTSKRNWGEFGEKKAIILDLFLEAIDEYKKEHNIEGDLTIEEQKLLCHTMFNSYTCKDILTKTNEITQLAIKTGIGCIFGIIKNNRNVIEEEVRVMVKDNKKGLTFNTGIFDFYKDTTEESDN